MFSIIKTSLKFVSITALLAGLAAGGTMLVAGPHRAKAIFDQGKDYVCDTIDKQIDETTALRAQLTELEREYPRKIAEVRGELAVIGEQVRMLEREHRISARVVSMAERDLEELEPLLAEAEAARVEHGATQLVSVRFDDRVWEFDRALARAHQIRQTAAMFAGRGADADHDLNYLLQQATQFEELLLQLTTEHARFQTQLQQLERQVDSIARNDRLIEIVEARQRTFDECSRYEIVSLDQITQRLAQIRSRQVAELDVLANQGKAMDYEEMARYELQAEEGGVEVKPAVVWQQER